MRIVPSMFILLLVRRRCVMCQNPQNRTREREERAGTHISYPVISGLT